MGRALAEMSGAPAFAKVDTAQTDFTQQPYLPGAMLPAAGQVCVAYLDVWQRDVTWLEHPLLVDKAVNIDTTGRLQTIWQVKLLNLGNPPSTPDCSTDIPAFDALSAAPAGRLTRAVSCRTPPAARAASLPTPATRARKINSTASKSTPAARRPRRRREATAARRRPGRRPSNGPADNASIQTSVSAISTVATSSGSVSQLTVASLGRDQILGFAVNDWIEIADDGYDLQNQAGEIFQITGVTAATSTITLERRRLQPLPALRRPDQP